MIEVKKQRISLDFFRMLEQVLVHRQLQFDSR